MAIPKIHFVICKELPPKRMLLISTSIALVNQTNLNVVLQCLNENRKVLQDFAQNPNRYFTLHLKSNFIPKLTKSGLEQLSFLN